MPLNSSVKSEFERFAKMEEATRDAQRAKKAFYEQQQRQEISALLSDEFRSGDSVADHTAEEAAEEQWEEVLCGDTGKPYFFNRISGETTWRDPRQRRNGGGVETHWTEHTNPETNQVYYYNHFTGESRWDRPTEMGGGENTGEKVLSNPRRDRWAKSDFVDTDPQRI